MDAGALEAARTGKTKIAELGNVFMARRVNQILGGAIVAPWEIDLMPDELLDAILAVDTIGEVKSGLDTVENTFAKWRSSYANKRT